MRPILLPALSAMGVGIAIAQSPDELPGKLTGRWTASTPRGVAGDTFALVFDGSGKPGPVTGRLTFRGVVCGAQDEPFNGTWDGSELRIESVHRPNVNVQRVNGQCGTGNVIYVLQRKSGDKAFEGEARPGEGATGSVASITASP